MPPILATKAPTLVGGPGPRTPLNSAPQWPLSCSRKARCCEHTILKGSWDLVGYNWGYKSPKWGYPSYNLTY